ncbi:putative inorganic phosphate cotransporter [Galleria mellonella]|uniref:Inorganic phosphate cotransporter n=1 Tax=Galleria mellonella TaxID=7137 RepID=A0ABM3M928_GALME|nr:putative inorganic phosphate cotransporter [Galleria mellonella]
MSKGEYQEVPTKDEKQPEKPIKEDVIQPYGYGVRHVQTFIMFICLTVGYIARAYLSVSIVAMTNKSNHTNILENIQNDTTEVLEDLQEIRTDNNDTILIYNDSMQNISIFNDKFDMDPESSLGIYRTYDWPKSTQEMVLSSFFLGYNIMQFPMGLVTQRWGGKIPLQIGLFTNGITCIVAPWLVLWGGWRAVCACRIVQGLSQAGVYPSIQTLLAQWVPKSERGRLASYVYTGSTLGTVIAFQVGGILAESAGGWPSIFWATGSACLLMFVLLTVFGAATPAQHKTITEAEKSFIANSSNTAVKEKPKVPWKALLTSRYVWACIATQIGSGISFFFIFTQVPSYIHSILEVDVKSSGLLSSLPYVAACCFSVLFGVISDFCLNRKMISVKNSRRLFNSVSQVGAALCLISVSFTKKLSLAIILLMLATGFQPGIHVGWMINHIDLTPNFSGTLIAVGNSLMNVFVLITPVFVSYIVTDLTNQLQWRIMFIIVGVCAIVTNGIFVALMTADVQPWNDPDYNKKTNTEKESIK